SRYTTFLYFFFQAEDGIRDFHVTGVQTCALPISETAIGYKPFAPNMRNGKIVSIVKQMIPILDDLQSYNLKIQHIIGSAIPKGRSEERRVGKECRSRWSA